MKAIPVNSWEEFEKKLEELSTFWSSIRQSTPLLVSDPLFRGHSDAEWHLKTTLERYLKSPCSLYQYYRVVHAAKPRIETFTEKAWGIPTVSEYQEWLDNYDPFEVGEFFAYEYMAYLRHHSFPSPLLDWTTSPYVAAYFAFRDISSNSQAVAVFAYVEYTGQGKSSKVSESYIRTLGPYIRSHKRHFLQQSKYTICTILSDQGPLYKAHEEAFAHNREDQDLLWKFVIPATERTKALRKLDSYNINAYSLFSSEESLMETIAVSEFILRRRA